MPHRDVSFRPFTASIFIYRNINPPPEEHTYAENNREPPEYYGSPARHLGQSRRNETPFTCGVYARGPPSLKFQRNSTFEHAPTTEYSIVEITPARYKAVSVRQMWLEIFDRSFLLLTRSNLTMFRRNRRFHCMEQQTTAHASFSLNASFA